jgi:small subunit ribosomal protein S8e
MPIHQKKRSFEKARHPAMTKLGHKRIHLVRGRGANMKRRALRLDVGNFAWASESLTHKSRILAEVYNATNNELVRTNTLTKNTIVQVDATPFKNWYYRQYGAELGKKHKEDESKTRSTKAQEKFEEIKKQWEVNSANRLLDPHVEEQFKAGRLLASISSRPGQSGRADGYILEGEELEFYKKKLEKKKSK